MPLRQCLSLRSLQTHHEIFQRGSSFRPGNLLDHVLRQSLMQNDENGRLSMRLVRQRSSLLKAVITAFPSVSLPFLAVPLLSQPTLVALSSGRRWCVIVIMTASSDS
eukprot:SAG22_NODE_3890_length_1481_cov_1.711288_2_plen_107_part_00